MEQLLTHYVDPEHFEEPTLPSEKRSEASIELWTIVEKMWARSLRFQVLVDTYPFFAYAGNYWLQHADLGIEHFNLSAFPWILNENSSVFASWRSMSSIEGGLVPKRLGDLGMMQLEGQMLTHQSPDIVGVSAHLGLSKLLFKLLKDFSERNHKHRALTAAAYAGMVERVTTLLCEKDVLTPRPFRALMMVAPSIHVYIVSLLLDAVRRAGHGVDDGRFSDCIMIATIGAWLSPTSDMIKAVYEICRNQNN